MTHQRRSYLYDVDTTAPKKATGPLERATTKKKKGKEAFFISPLLSSSPLSPSPLSPLSSASPPSIFLVTWAPPSHGRTVSFPNERPAHRAGLGNGLRFLCKKAPPLFFPPHITLAYCCSMICFWRLFPSRCSNSTPIHRCFWWLRVLVPSSQYEQSAAVVSQLQPCLQIYPHVKAKVGQYGWLLLPFCFCFVE